jgi:tRNA(Ile)-lysidine synthase
VSVVTAITSGVRDDALLAPGRAVVVLLSGGRDSTCLLDLATTVCGAQAVTALHVNYGLRDSADGDQQHCRELCARLGVELTVQHAGPPSGNKQAWARELRYRAAALLALSRAADIAAGHTATDQVETILYRLASSPSRRALLGMRPREGDLIRPLLRFTREQTGAYCVERGLSWRDDESNDSDAYARGRVRCARSIPAPSASCSRSPRRCVRRPRCSRSWSTTSSRAGTRSSSHSCGRCPRRSRG